MEPEMNEDDVDYVMEFDRHYTNNHIQILKAFFGCVENIPYIPVIIKYLELKETLKMVKSQSTISASEKQNISLDKLYRVVKPYLSSTEDQSCQQILSLVHTIDQAKEMKQMMEMLQMTQVFHNEEETNSNENNNNQMDIDLSEMLKLISKEYNL